MISGILKRPRGTAIIYIAFLGLAVVSFLRIPIEGSPSTTLPELNVITGWYGADPEAVCEQVTRPIEEVARQIRGVKDVSSSSSEGRSVVTVSFAQDSDMDVASMELTERISMIRDDLPGNVSASTITQSIPREMESDGFLIYAITGAEKSILKNLAEDVVVPRLERVDGVSSVMVEGLGTEEVLIDIDMEALKSLDLTLAQVVSSIQNGIVDRNVGVVTDSTALESVLRVSSVPMSLWEMEQLVVKRNGSDFVTLDDVSHGIYQSYSESSGFIFRYNGLDQITMELDRAAGSNAVRVASIVKNEVEKIQLDLPEGIELNIVEDGTESITDDLSALSWRALVSLGLIMLILLLLNPSPLTTPLILSSILFSSALAVTAVFLAGYSINVLTLSALAIAFGLLVDGAVVVMEAIAYRRRQGMTPLKAAAQGAREVAMPVLGGILTTLVALVPLLASEGVLRIYYRPFAFTVAATLLASYAVCLTFVPSIAGHWKKGNWYRQRKWDRALARGVSVLHHKPWIPVIFTILLIAGAVYVLISKVEHGRTWNFGGQRDYTVVFFTFPPGTPQEISDDVAKKFESILADRDGIQSTRTSVYGESGNLYTMYEDESLLNGVALLYEDEAKALATTVGGIQSIYVGGISPEGYWRNTTSAGMMQTVELRGFDYQGLKGIAVNLRALLERHPRVDEVDINWNGRIANRDQLAIVFDRIELADLGINPYQLVMALRYNMSGGYGAQVRIADQTTDLTFRLEGQKDPELSEILDSRIRTRDGFMRMRDIISIDTVGVQGSVVREDGEYVRTVAYSFMGAERMAARFRNSLLTSLELPSGYRVYEDTTFLPDWLAEEEGIDMNLLVALAILAVFAVTAIVFESFTAPLYVLAVIPMALVGVAAGFWAFDRIFSPEAYVGSVFLVGIAVNNSILLIDSFEKKKRAGMNLRKAVDEVVGERLRPILQTTATTVLGLLPLVLWPISNQDLWGTLAFTVVCGMLISTPLVLITLPALIQITSRRRKKHVQITEN
ncbi:MAG: efflux RND transporter permease subunit [Candidatus Sabulitectum sp.]|nr:efflux RND transporter permease subunit [Candidatus Sabulitectum sp.]